jgi:hypothetical protein
MNPRIDATRFGTITVGTVFGHDIVISRDGEVTKRRKKLSSAIYGTSHTISLDEAYHLDAKAGADRLIIGSGQTGMVRLSSEAADFFARKGCAIVLLPTPEAIHVWNETRGNAAGLFHVTLLTAGLAVGSTATYANWPVNAIALLSASYQTWGERGPHQHRSLGDTCAASRHRPSEASQSWNRFAGTCEQPVNNSRQPMRS